MLSFAAIHVHVICSYMLPLSRGGVGGGETACFEVPGGRRQEVVIMLCANLLSSLQLQVLHVAPVSLPVSIVMIFMSLKQIALQETCSRLSQPHGWL